MSLLIDMAGWVMKEHGVPDSLLTVIKRDFEKEKEINKKRTYWKCLCECGTTFSVDATKIRSGHTLSCGCKREKINPKLRRIDISNKRYGMLVAININEEETARHKKGTYWNCECECGGKKTASLDHLRNGHVKSCGCIESSFGEKKVENLLVKNNIPFEKEKRFFTCINIRPLPFDFLIDDSFLLEVDGKQHFTSSGMGSFFDEETVKNIKKRDAIKNNWCFENNIPLKRIPYTDLQKLTIEDIMGDKYLVKGEEPNE